MFTGLMWFDSDPKKTLQVKVAEAARRYFEKFGQLPSVCYVNPLALDDALQVQMIAVRPLRSVMPNHLWIGKDPKKHD